jgi:peroxiredoxin
MRAASRFPLPRLPIAGDAVHRVFLTRNPSFSTKRSFRMTIQTGSAAPDFSLAAHNTDQKVTLSSFRGRPVVVAFMPFAFTGG